MEILEFIIAMIFIIPLCWILGACVGVSEVIIKEIWKSSREKKAQTQLKALDPNSDEYQNKYMPKN